MEDREIILDSLLYMLQSEFNKYKKAVIKDIESCTINDKGEFYYNGYIEKQRVEIRYRALRLKEIYMEYHKLKQEDDKNE